jgi:DNA-binding LacI/PurR family transcriptional regulator
LAAEKLINSNKEFTAVFCASDLMAVGAIEMFDNFGLKVPEDISIVGFDDITIAQYMSPKLTTIRQDRYKIGESAATALINLINGQSFDRIVVMPELVIRESTKELI